MSAQTIYTTLTQAGMTSESACAMLGNMMAESSMMSNNVENGQSLYSDEKYTTSVDNGTYNNFARDGYGYGLCSWTYSSRKTSLQNFAKRMCKSIGDETMQVQFCIDELKCFYTTLWKWLCINTDIRSATERICLEYEKPKINNILTRVEYAKQFYNQYNGNIQTSYEQTNNLNKELSNMNEKQIRQAVIEKAKSYLGCRESDGSHRKIVDVYNSIRPLPVSYKLSYTDAWCAGFVSAVGKELNLTDVILPECSCDRMIALYKKAGRWQENDAYKPQPADIIFYDWQDSGYGDAAGGSDHVGIVESINGNTITVIEGNISDSVGRRNIAINGKFIRGYGLPKYGSTTATTTNNITNTTTTVNTTTTNTNKKGMCEVTLNQLSKGAKGQQVKSLQLLLIGNGYSCGSAGADGDFGNGTYNAVVLFQGKKKLETDGIVGSNTWNALLKG